MRIGRAIYLLPLLLAGCRPGGMQADQEAQSARYTSLTQARTGFKSALKPEAGDRQPVEQPPPGTFHTVKYPTESGELAAYLTDDPGDGQRHPAIIWITGGDCNSIGDVWSEAPSDNDQTAAAYRHLGIVLMFPSLRGGNNGPGVKEGFLGEVDDVLAAAKFLEAQPYVDPKRIYLGGHSTGGTLALLVAESSDRFRAVFSFGPVADVAGYGSDSGFLPFDMSKPKEVMLRSPGYWLKSLKSPVWIIEGESGNIEALREMKSKAAGNPKAHFVEVAHATHFSTLGPTNYLLAKKVVQDTGSETGITLTDAEASENFARGGSP
jgi:dipeptidyl aminopeptidase/acylaminoacyl peptidase